MKIFFVRHGHTDKGDLDERGMRQINEAAEFLKGVDLDIPHLRLLTSELVRAVNSAKIIQTVLGCPAYEKVAWLTCDSGSNIPACMVDFSQTNPQCQSIIAVSHMPEIETSVERFAGSFGVNFGVNAGNCSIYLVDTTAKRVEKLFQPR